MFSQLPARPNLEQLRKQAKNLLRRMREEDPAAKLADAQHAVARDYGFASWPALKTHVEAIAAAFVPAATPPFSGRWVATVSKSGRHPAHPFQCAVVEFDVAGDMVTIADRTTDAAGHGEHRSNHVTADGREHPAGSGYTMVCTWRHPLALEAIARSRGQVVGRVVYEVSADGRTLTISSQNARENAGGWQSEVDQTVVFERRSNSE